MFQNRRWLAIFGIFFLSALCGCVKEVVQGETTVYYFQLWVSITIVVIGLFFLVLGLALLRSSLKVAIMLTLFSLFILGGLLPNFATAYLKIDNQHFELNNGWPFGPKYNIRFDDLKQVVKVKSSRLDRKGKKITDYYFECYLKNQPEPIQINSGGELFSKAEEKLISQIQQHNVPFVDRSNNS